MSRIEHSDCLSFLQKQETESVGLVIIDPPYNIDYAEWDSVPNYVAWLVSVTDECLRVLMPNRMLCVWGTLKTDEGLRFLLEMQKRAATRQNEIVWSYNWGGRGSHNFARKHEYVWCFSKGSSFLFNAEAVKVERKTKNNPRTGMPYANGTVPTCVWEKNNHTMSKEFVKWHPTQKPVSLLTRLVLGYSNVGDTVLDCFAGSGSTAIACKETFRQFKGCDSSAEFVSKANNRIENW